MTTWLVSSQLLAAGVAFVVNLLAASVLDPTGRGQLALTLQVGYLLAILGMLGMERPFTANVSGRQFNETVSFLERLVRPGYWAGIIGLLLVLYGLGTENYSFVMIGVLSTIFVVSTMHMKIVRTAYIASRTWRPFVFTGIASQVLLVACCLLLTVLHVGAFEVWFAAYTVAGLVATVVICTPRRVSPPVDSGQAKIGRTVRSQGLRLLPASLGNTAMVRSDRLLIPALSSAAELGIYVVVATAIDMATWPVQQWADSRLHAWKEAPPSKRMVSLMCGIALIITVGLVAVIAFLLDYIVTQFLPKPYAAGMTLFLPLSVAAIFYSLSRLTQGVLISRGAGTAVSVIEGAGMAVSILAYLVLIPSLGALGAAYGSVLGYSVCFFVSCVMAIRQKSEAP